MKKQHSPELQAALFELFYRAQFLKRKKSYGIRKALEFTSGMLYFVEFDEAKAVEMFRLKLPAKYHQVIEDCIKKSYSENKEILDKIGIHTTPLI